MSRCDSKALVILQIGAPTETKVYIFNVEAKLFNYVFDQTGHGELIQAHTHKHTPFRFLYSCGCSSAPPCFALLGSYWKCCWQHLLQSDNSTVTPRTDCIRETSGPKLPSCPLLICDPQNECCLSVPVHWRPGAAAAGAFTVFVVLFFFYGVKFKPHLGFRFWN